MGLLLAPWLRVWMGVQDLISGPARSAPSSLVGTGMLAGLIHLIDRRPQLDGSDDSEAVLQVAEHAARMNACPPPAKVLLDCEWMPAELRHTTLDNLLLRVDKSGASRLGLSINFEAGVSWRHADIAYCEAPRLPVDRREQGREH